jgi:hypothetical protein
MYASFANTGVEQVEQAGQRGVGGAAVQGLVQGRLNITWVAWAWTVCKFRHFCGQLGWFNYAFLYCIVRLGYITGVSV